VPFLVIASINDLTNLATFKHELAAEECTVLVIDEGDAALRGRNKGLLEGIDHRFYGPRERVHWFKARFRSSELASVIPRRCHAETSFGFLVAYEEDANIVIEIDDDVCSFENSLLVGEHVKNLSGRTGFTINSSSKWYNTLTNLVFDRNASLFPRGHPYSTDARLGSYNQETRNTESVLNMGLWSGDPDLDAATLLSCGGLNSKSQTKSLRLLHDRITVGRGTYFALCSMNTAFRRLIVPAFYQLYMNELGIDRFDDIWSGIFIKRIADQVGDSISLGAPILRHEKRPREVFKDLRAECEGIAINEVLWRVVDSIDLQCRDYFGCYQEMADGLEKKLPLFHSKLHMEFLKLQVRKMRLWLKVIDRLR
jgi:hypothetical protein